MGSRVDGASNWSFVKLTNRLKRLNVGGYGDAAQHSGSRPPRRRRDDERQALGRRGRARVSEDGGRPSPFRTRDARSVPALAWRFHRRRAGRRVGSSSSSRAEPTSCDRRSSRRAAVSARGTASPTSSPPSSRSSANAGSAATFPCSRSTSRRSASPALSHTSRDALPVGERGPVCLLACAEGDDHTLGLSLAELCLREAGWATLWAGRCNAGRGSRGRRRAGRDRHGGPVCFRGFGRSSRCRRTAPADSRPRATLRASSSRSVVAAPGRKSPDALGISMRSNRFTSLLERRSSDVASANASRSSRAP